MIGALLLFCTLGIQEPSDPPVDLRAAGQKVVVLTFDDALRTHFTVVRPILLEHGFSATFFITEGFTFRTDKRNYMTWKQIRRLHEDGFEIGNHGRDHVDLTPRTLRGFEEQIRSINEKCARYGIPQPISYAFPGNAFVFEALPILERIGFRLARRGGSPEFPYEGGRGVAFEPGRDHPLLIPSAGDARPDWTIDDFERALQTRSSSSIPVLQFHGVPDTAHPWVSTSVRRFRELMGVLEDEGYSVLALRDLLPVVEASPTPADPRRILVERQQ